MRSPCQQQLKQLACSPASAVSRSWVMTLGQLALMKLQFRNVQFELAYRLAINAGGRFDGASMADAAASVVM